jgi:hypothetical protein
MNRIHPSIQRRKWPDSAFGKRWFFQNGSQNCILLIETVVHHRQTDYYALLQNPIKQMQDRLLSLFSTL